MIQITLAVTGSISAYKAADITSQLGKLGYTVSILMTEAASHFITPLTLQVLSKNPVTLDIMEEPWPDKVNHIEIAKKTNLFLVAPATANTIAKLANGLADNMVTATALALPSHVKKVIAPAMNTKMYEHPIVQRNMRQLQAVDVQFIEPAYGELACNTVGKGRMEEPENIVAFLKDYFEEN